MRVFALARVRRPQTNLVTFIQRFGSALNLNIDLHLLGNRSFNDALSRCCVATIALEVRAVGLARGILQGPGIVSALYACIVQESERDARAASR